MTAQKKRSITKIANIIPFLLIALVIINIISISLLGFFYLNVSSSENQSGEYFRTYNSYILMVVESSGEPSDEILSLYSRLDSEFESMNGGLTRHTSLPKPEYNTEDEQAEYRDLLRDHATYIRQNLSLIIENSYIYIGLILFISIFVNIFLIIIMIIYRHSVNSYLVQMSNGLNYIKKLLKFEKHSNYESSGSGIIELEELDEAVFDLSNDLSFNRELLESGMHGHLDNLMAELNNNLSRRMPCDRIALAFINSEDWCIAESAVTSYPNLHLRPGYKEVLSSTSLESLLEDDSPRIIDDLIEYSQNRKISESTKLILKEGIKSSITIPMIFEGTCLGFFFVSSREKDAYDDSMAAYALRVVNLLKQKFYIKYLLQEVISETSNSFVSLMAEKDNETSAHIVRMSQFSYITARSYHEIIKPLHPQFMREILWYAPLHDIGKVGIPDSILLKEGPLSKAEMDVMKRHVDIGHRVIEKMNSRIQGITSSKLLTTAIDIILGHHEKFNGTGYPSALSGEQIPLPGRIVAIADVFDALTSRRPYKEAYSVERALEIIETDMKGSFDPYVIKAFKHGLPEIRSVYEELKEI